VSIKSCNNFTATFDRVFEQTVQTLEELVRIPSVSVNPTDLSIIDQSAEFVLKLFQNEGIEAKIVSAPRENGQQGNPAIIGVSGDVDPNKPTILLYAHHDVQPAQHPENWETDPFEPVRKVTADGERLFGRGSADDGAGLVSHLGVLRLYKQLGKELPVNFKVFIEGEEECGSPSFPNFIEQYKDKLQADVIIVADSGNWAVGVPAITTTLRGVCTIDLELSVLEHAIHSGMSSGPIIDANALLMRLISSIWDDKGNVSVPGLFWVESEPADSIDFAEADFRKDVGLLDGVQLAGTGTIAGRIWNKPSVAVIGFDATPVNKASNVFAPTARARLSLRVPPRQDSAEAAHYLKEYLESKVPFGAHFKWTLQECGPGFVADVDSTAAVALKASLEEAFGAGVVYSGMGGSIPFTADLKRVFPKAEVLLIGVEDPDSRAHSDNESVHLGDLKKVLLAEVLLLEKLSQVAQGGGNHE
jgi:acetylornithine deacetylase/succinyl-diaminopimelate desuccinylase-like protein